MKPRLTERLGLIITASVVLLSSCRSALQEQSAKEEDVVAKINNYQMTVSDFKDRVNFILESKYLSVEPNEAKDELLDELITRNVLLQEAQKRNLDKQRAFMNEIERYWEQSLLKLLLQKRAEEILATIKVEDNEVIDEYLRMKRKIYAQLVILNERQDAERLSQASGDNFGQIQDSLGKKIISGELPQWWTLGDLPRYLEEPLFALTVGQISAPVQCGNNWAVIKVNNVEEKALEPFDNLAAVIKANIQKRKKDDALDAWIKDLKKNVTIKINKELLREINLE